MEKLQPIIRQIFWVLFGLGLILILWGWYAASSGLSADIEIEKKKVDATVRDAGQVVTAVPNPGKWISKASELNEEHKEAFDESAEKLWRQQLDARVFHPRIRREMEQYEFRANINNKPLRGVFRKLYSQLFQAQLNKIKPFKPETGRGLVNVVKEQITQENPTKWKRKLPTSPEIWNAQEDIWLVSSIFDAIAEVNSGADRIDKAPLRALLQLKLRGGDPDAKPGESAAAGGLDGTGGMGGGMEGGFTGNGGFGAGAAGGLGGGSSWTTYQGSTSADLLTEEFGPDSAAGATGAFGGGLMAGQAEDGGFGGADGFGGGASEGEEGGEGESTADRYVHYSEELPYKTRAFTLVVKISQKSIPKLLAALPNGKFPVEIVRVDANFGGASSGGLGSGLTGGGLTGGGEGYGGLTGGGEGYGGGGEGYGGAGGLSGGMSMGAGPGSGLALGGPGGGMGLSGPGSGMGLGGPGLGAGGAGMRPVAGNRGNSKLTRQERNQIANGQRLFTQAMSDPNLATVRVAGLMTIYESRQEKKAEAESQEAAESEADDTAEPLTDSELNDTTGAEEITEDAATDDSSVTADGSSPADGSAAVDGSTPNATEEPAAGPETGNSSDGTVPSADGASTDEPAPGSNPEQPQSGNGQAGIHRGCFLVMTA